MWRNAVSKFISATVINAKNSLNRPMSAKPIAPTVNASTGSFKSQKKAKGRKSFSHRCQNPNRPRTPKTYQVLSKSHSSAHHDAAPRPSTTKGLHTNAYLLAYVPPPSKIAKNSSFADSHSQPSKSFADVKKTERPKKSPCADPKNPSPNPCGGPKTPSPSKSPCDEIKKMETPCPEAKSPCSSPPPPCDGSSMSSSAMNCYHHKDLVPPPSVLSQLKSFELKSDCSSFHMKAEGFGCCK